MHLFMDPQVLQRPALLQPLLRCQHTNTEGTYLEVVEKVEADFVEPSRLGCHQICTMLAQATLCVLSPETDETCTPYRTLSLSLLYHLLFTGQSRVRFFKDFDSKYDKRSEVGNCNGRTQIYLVRCSELT